jgi:hypothetical protein
VNGAYGTEPGTYTTQLQGIGWHAAKPAMSFAPGDTIVWNYGYTSTVVDVIRCSACFVSIRTVSQDGKVYARRFKTTYLLGWKA